MMVSGWASMYSWNLCTSSRDWLSFWSASRMTSVSLWMMTSRGPCSSIGRLRFSCTTSIPRFLHSSAKAWKLSFLIFFSLSQ